MDADRCIVVPSAPGKRSSTDIKVTDLFYECNRLAAAGKDIGEAFERIRERYHGIAQELGLRVNLDAYLSLHPGKCTRRLLPRRPVTRASSCSLIVSTSTGRICPSTRRDIS